MHSVTRPESASCANEVSSCALNFDDLGRLATEPLNNTLINIAPERPAATRDEINLQEQRGPLRNSVDPVKVAEFDGFYGVTHPALARFLQPTPYYPVVDEGLGLTRSIGRRDSNTSVVAVGYEWNSFFGGTAANTSESYYEVVKQAE